MKMNHYIIAFYLVIVSCFLWCGPSVLANAPDDSRPPLGVIDSSIVDIGYSERELLHYDVSWSGGIKIGELHLEKNCLDRAEDVFEIRAFITTKGGAVHYVYPIRDLHVTKVKGARKLPYHYEVWQDEGYSYNAHRVFEYDQEKHFVSYTKNKKNEGAFQLSGEVNNEFSSFFNSRLMDFTLNKPFVVPTFADKKRVDVAVYPQGRKEFKDTVLGNVSTVEIMPVMQFKGLYDKKGDTIIWYTDDKCRVPVEIKSKIAIGSLTAKLKKYENPTCDLYLQQTANKRD